MAEEQGVVLRVTEDGWADVLTERSDACQGCGASHCCAGSGNEKKMVTRALNRAGAEPCDRVSLKLETGTLMKGATVLYLIPIMGFLVGAVVGAVIHESVPLSETKSEILFAFGGLGLSFLLASYLSRWLSRKGALTPVISRVIVKGKEKIADFIDPVCKMMVNPSSSAGSFKFNNIVYYFCSEGCRVAFQKDPDRYLGT